LRKAQNLEPINEDIKIEEINILTAAIGYKQLKKLEIIQKREKPIHLSLKVF